MQKTMITLCVMSCLGAMGPAYSQGRSVGNPIFPPSAHKAKPEPPQATGKEIFVSEIPKFPGARFISGEELHQQGVDKACIIHYSIPKSSESQVIPFYSNALNGSGWEIEQESTNSLSASNTKLRADCSISVSSDDEFFRTIEVNYTQTSAGPESDSSLQ
jgi:hypothetical protein